MIQSFILFFFIELFFFGGIVWLIVTVEAFLDFFAPPQFFKISLKLRIFKFRIVYSNLFLQVFFILPVFVIDFIWMWVL